MSSAAPQGVFITFEGGEGAGKSTQIERLAAALRARGGREVVATREPGGTPRGEAFREALLAGRGRRHGPFGEALLFCAARIDHIDMLIRPALTRGAIVLCDRFADSTRAYQGAASGLDDALLRALERVTLAGTRPDLTLILDLPPEIGLARAQARAAAGATGDADRFEAEAVTFHARLRAAFKAIAAEEPGRCAVIDARPDAASVAAAIAATLAARLPQLLAEATGAGAEQARTDAA